MKASIKVLTLAGVLCAGLLTLDAADKRIPGGPKGGRLLEKTDPRAEFLIESNHRVTVTFYDTALKPVPAAGQSVTVIADAKAGRQTLEFEAKAGALVSKTPLPAGDGYNLVVQLKASAGASPQNFRFKLDLAHCGGCKRAEYACTCGH